MKNPQAKPKLRDDLTDIEKAQAVKIDWLEFKSVAATRKR